MIQAQIMETLTMLWALNPKMSFGQILLAHTQLGDKNGEMSIYYYKDEKLLADLMEQLDMIRKMREKGK